MNNNDIFKKLRVALFLKDTDIVEILKKVEFEITTSELSAFFRSEDHPNFRKCGDQVLRKFLDGLIIRNREIGVEKFTAQIQEKNQNRIAASQSTLPKVNSKSKSVMRERKFKSEDQNKPDRESRD